MEREIKFRAKGFGKWHYGSYVHFDKKPTNGCCNINYKDFIVANGDEHYFPITELSSVGQYTGLKDKNGKEIYEGDIVENGGYYNIMGVVCYDTQYAHYFIFNEASGESIDFVEIFSSEVEVIGNIHDNPELIKKR